jgi:phosphatidylserine/phosphatidylglycerophosphate/cardiolipin synthase-like enzyme
MSEFENGGEQAGFRVKLWRGERMCLIGLDVKSPEPDLVGFAIECKSPGAGQTFQPLRNRLAFSYDRPATEAVTGYRNFPPTENPFQKFRWVHFPHEPRAGKYVYRATKMHMPRDAAPVKGTAIELDISLDPVTYDGFVDIGFTRNFASSQAYVERYGAAADVIPADPDQGLAFTKKPGDVYEWLGFEAYDLIVDFLDRAVADKAIHVDAMTYDFNEPDLLARLEKLGTRLRIIMDDSSKKKDGVIAGHAATKSPESRAAARLRQTAGAGNVKRTHFHNLQHHKVLIARKNGQAVEVLAGSTNFSFRGLYIQANNVLVFKAPDVAAWFAAMFDRAFRDPESFENDALAKTWHVVHDAGTPTVHVAFSPHTSSDLALNPVRGAVDQATSSVLYAVAFLDQLSSGPTKQAFDRVMHRPVFSYGISDKAGQLEVRKPDGSTGLVDFAYLAANAPQPFKREWSGGKGINIHHKFVVTDFSLLTAKVFTGSSNLSPSGEKNNGDHLLMIADRKIATGYALEALRVFDHLHFRSRMKDAQKKNKTEATKALTLKKPRAISGEPAWFEEYYVAGSQRARDRELFSR